MHLYDSPYGARGAGELPNPPKGQSGVSRSHSELARLQELEEAVQEAWDAYDQGHSAKQAIRMVGKALGWA